MNRSSSPLWHIQWTIASADVRPLITPFAALFAFSTDFKTMFILGMLLLRVSFLKGWSKRWPLSSSCIIFLLLSFAAIRHRRQYAVMWWHLVVWGVSEHLYLIGIPTATNLLSGAADTIALHCKTFCCPPSAICRISKLKTILHFLHLWPLHYVKNRRFCSDFEGGNLFRKPNFSFLFSKNGENRCIIEAYLF